MAVEIERKFLVVGDQWRALAIKNVPMRQGYLGGDKCSIRVRVEGNSANLNIKSLSAGISRLEYEYSIDAHDALELLENFASNVVSKRRHYLPQGSHVWEIDEFEGENVGLIVAEIELADAGEHIDLPEWVGAEVSEDTRYYNAALAKMPYSKW